MALGTGKVWESRQTCSTCGQVIVFRAVQDFMRLEWKLQVAHSARDGVRIVREHTVREDATRYMEIELLDLFGRVWADELDQIAATTECMEYERYSRGGWIPIGHTDEGMTLGGSSAELVLGPGKMFWARLDTKPIPPTPTGITVLKGEDLTPCSPPLGDRQEITWATTGVFGKAGN